METVIRFAREDDLAQINELRRQVNELHAAGKPEIFRPCFSDEMRDYLYEIRSDAAWQIIAAEADGAVLGYATLHHIQRPENPVMRPRDYLEIDEFGVDEAFRRRGIASAMIAFIRAYAREKGFSRIELNMWEFNRDALAFYEAVGFSTYRRQMEMDV